MASQAAGNGAWFPVVPRQDVFVPQDSPGCRTQRYNDIPVIDLESLLAMKLHALKDQEERAGRDLLDIRLLLKENAQAITDQRLRELCQRFAGPDAYALIRPIE